MKQRPLLGRQNLHTNSYFSDAPAKLLFEQLRRCIGRQQPAHSVPARRRKLPGLWARLVRVLHLIVRADADLAGGAVG
jgi:hypothetical protein